MLKKRLKSLLLEDQGKYTKMLRIAAIVISAVFVFLIVLEFAIFKDYFGGVVTLLIQIFVGVCLTVQGIIREFQNEKFTEKQKELELAMQTQSRFLANMSHEIRTPINTIIGLNEMTLRENISDEVAENAINIQSASKMLLSVINDILDISKIESGKMDIVETAYNLGDMFSDIVNMNWNRAHSKNLEFQVSISEKLPSRLIGDDIRLKQVLNNLLSNAIKYTPEGSVQLSVYGEMIDDLHVRLRMSVSDSGIGIKPDDLTHLFENFKRVDEASTKGIEGTGLGLAITKQLVELMGGTITVDSIYHKGSTFTVEVVQRVSDLEPLGEMKYNRAKVSDRQMYKRSFAAPEARILVVDDNDMNLLVAKKLLRDTEVQLDLAKSGMEAVKLTLKNQYDLIFMDHMMPDMDGIQTLSEIKSQIGGLNKEVPIIALTANAMSGASEYYQQFGFSNYLSKPISGAHIEAALVSYLPENKVEYEVEAVEAAEISGLTLKEREYRKKVQISVDGICDLPDAIIKQYDIEKIAFYINTGNGKFREERELGAVAAVNFMQGGNHAFSQAPTKTDYELFFGKMLGIAENVIHITIAKSQGKDGDEAYVSASAAANSFSHVTVIDSDTLSSGTGMLALYAGRLAVEGRSADEIVKALHEYKKKVSTSFVISEPDFMYYNQRLSKNVWDIMKRITLRPVITMKNGELKVTGAKFADERRSMLSYVKSQLKGKRNVDTKVAFVTYCGVSEEVRAEVIEEILKYQKFEKIYQVSAGAAISINCGPGTLGVIYARKK